MSVFQSGFLTSGQPIQVATLEFLLIAGGGGGGNFNAADNAFSAAGGGGAGGGGGRGGVRGRSGVVLGGCSVGEVCTGGGGWVRGVLHVNFFYNFPQIHP